METITGFCHRDPALAGEAIQEIVMDCFVPFNKLRIPRNDRPIFTNRTTFYSFASRNSLDINYLLQGK